MSKKYTWKDIVKVNGEIHAEEFEISGEMDDENTFIIDDFIEAVAKKYGVDPDDVETYMLDDIYFDVQELPYGAEACGCYINGIPEWYIKDIGDIKTSPVRLIEVKVNRKALIDWLNTNYIPKENEIICYGTGMFKLGDGICKFKDLPDVTMAYAFKEGYVYYGNTKISIEV